jgi:maltose O-acetyltransferase
VPAGASVRIGAGCDLAPEVLVECGSHEIGPPTRRAGPGTARSVSVGDGCWIGARVVILGGAEIGTGCVIAAGAVVLPGSYAANSLLVGVPAKPVRMLGGFGT